MALSVHKYDAVVVGAGGAGSNISSGSAGLLSSFGGITAAGGGAGAAASFNANGASGSDGAVSSGGFGVGSHQYEQVSRPMALYSTAAVPYSSTGTYHPGAGGKGGYASGSNAVGGVGGLVLIEW